ncbi:Zn-ribbon domain-containing OB-fold protein [Georgenia alba]|uniref:Zn-ribbon domain-containing OB-fold protein n=1 Tax=Georgenia alba TaxID=2233858 RepID=A0ABW2Q3H4_9MICO
MTQPQDPARDAVAERATLLAGLDVPGPTPTAESRRFWDALAQGRFELPYCPACERWFFYPRAVCPTCWREQWGWRAASGRGTVAAWSVVHRPGHPGWAPTAPYPLAVVDLAEGPRMLAHVLADPADVHVGDRVAVRPTRVGPDTIAAVVKETPQ